MKKMHGQIGVGMANMPSRPVRLPLPPRTTHWGHGMLALGRPLPLVPGAMAKLLPPPPLGGALLRGVGLSLPGMTL